MNSWFRGSDADSIPKRCHSLFVIGELEAGGAEQQLVYLLQEIGRVRYRPALAVRNYQESNVNVPKVRSLGIPPGGHPNGASSYRKLYQFMRLAQMLSPDVEHSYSNYTDFAPFCAARASGAIGIGSVQNEIDPADFIEKRPIVGRLSATLPRIQISDSRAVGGRAESASGTAHRHYDLEGSIKYIRNV
jgi:hypothetical protein